MIKSEFVGWESRPTILATELVPKENIKSRKGWPARQLHIFLKRDDAWQLHVPIGRVNGFVIFRHHIDTVEKYGLDGVLPAPKRQREICERPKIGVQYQGRTIFEGR